jgi:hypothetical protein
MAGTSAQPVAAVAPVGAPVEWWQRLGVKWAAWTADHPTLTRRLRVARSVWLWASLTGLFVLAVVRPETREALGVFIQIYWLLVLWFLLARTRTVSWRLVAGLFSAGLVWSLVSGLVLYRLAQAATQTQFGSLTVPGQVRALGPMIALAGVGEESLKLAPLAVLPLLAPGRVRRFAVVDWLLLGFAAGLSFQAFEELARRTVAQVRGPTLADILGGPDGRGPASGYPQYSWSPLSGWSEWAPGTQFPGHHATTALVAGAVGLAIAGWRYAGRRPPLPRMGLRVASVAGPLIAWWLVVSVHAGGNATTRVGDRWLTADDPSVAWLLRSGWQAANHGVGLRWLLLAVLVTALLVDASRLLAADRLAPDQPDPEQPNRPLPPLPFDPAARSQAWTTRLTGASSPRALRTLVGAACALIAYTARDIAVLLTAHARQDGEPRYRSLVRGRAAGAMLRALREDAMESTAPTLGSPRVDSIRRRVTALTALGALVAATFVLAPAWAHRIGRDVEALNLATAPLDHLTWLAGLLDSLGTWWDGQSTGSKIAIAIGIAALVALSGGSLGLAFGVSGVGTYFLAHGHGAADFVRDPGTATRSYLATTTPTGVLADGAEAALTFGPWSFAGAAAGRGIRLAAEEYARDPALFIATRRALAHDDRGAVNAGELLAGSGGYLPKITDGGLAHSFDRHAKEWFGRPVGATAGREPWRQLVERASKSREIVAWSADQQLTFGHLARIEGKYFFVQFDRSTGDLVTAFVPNNSQLTAILRKLRS